MKFFISSLLLLIVHIQSYSLDLPPSFSSGMVIQQEAEVTIWGKAMPNTSITINVSWSDVSYSGKANSKGDFRVIINTPKASFDAQLIEISTAKSSKTLADVLVGDVWLLSGQSNMQMSFTGEADQPIADAQDILLESRIPSIRLFRVNNGYSLEAHDSITIDGYWQHCTPQNVVDFSVVGFVFGKAINECVDIPIGLIQSAHGGSTAEAWLDEKTLQEYGEFEIADTVADAIWYCQTPRVLYNKMLKPLLPLKVKGVLWYQGESNVERPEQYAALFPLLIKSWRNYLDNPELPFYFVQIAPYSYPFHNNVNAAYLREAQLKTMQTVAHTGMAVTMDAGLENVIHPPNKEVVGQRLAFWALNKTYGLTAFGCRGPEYKSMEVENNIVNLQFDYAPNGLSSYGKPLTGFEIAGEDRVFHPAEAKVKPAFWGNEGLQIWSHKVENPVAVRYGFSSFAEGTLYNTQGLPASSFRTDNWE